MTAQDDRLSAFLSRVESAECIDWCIARTGADPGIVAGKIRTYAGEVRVALALLDGDPLAGRRILDVGAGVGLATFFLAGEGHDVTALEPGGLGFDLNHDLFLAMRDYLGVGDVTLLSIGAEALDPEQHGRFDVMFSANVLEHVADLEAVVTAMARTLAPGGIMVHTCPNYTVPYEPHYRLPLLPFVPAATPWAGARKSEELWQSFNFVTARRLVRLLRHAGLAPVLAAGTMSRSFERLLVDPIFAARQSPMLVRIAKILQASGGMTVFRKWPSSLATPLVVTATKPRMGS